MPAYGPQGEPPFLFAPLKPVDKDKAETTCRPRLWARKGKGLHGRDLGVTPTASWLCLCFSFHPHRLCLSLTPTSPPPPSEGFYLLIPGGLLASVFSFFACANRNCCEMLTDSSSRKPELKPETLPPGNKFQVFFCVQSSNLS